MICRKGFKNCILKILIEAVDYPNVDLKLVSGLFLKSLSAQSRLVC